jgi:recombination protein RecT
MSNTTAVQKAPAATVLNHGERFKNAVIKEYGSGVVELSDRQKGLTQGYFVCIDRALKTAEEGRVQKNKYNRDHKWDNNVPVTWENVNIPELARDIVTNAKLGLDMTIPNHLFPIPYFNKDTQKYDVTLMKGYAGQIHIVEKYALHKPKNVVVELVYSTDYFVAVKKSKDNPVESYEFTIEKPFERGELRGGFGYIEFEDPTRNKLIIMTMEEIMKRKPKYASAEFWGGTKTKKVWNSEKNCYEKEEAEVQVEGWLPEMCLKTIKREVYSGKYLPIDPDKVDDNYQAMIARDLRYAELETENEIKENANTIPIAEVSPAAPLPPPSNPAGGDPF